MWCSVHVNLCFATGMILHTLFTVTCLYQSYMVAGNSYWSSRVFFKFHKSCGILQQTFTLPDVKVKPSFLFFCICVNMRRGGRCVGQEAVCGEGFGMGTYWHEMVVHVCVVSDSVIWDGDLLTWNGSTCLCVNDSVIWDGDLLTWNGSTCLCC